MATRSRVSAIRGYRATGGDYWSQPTPFQGGDVSGPAIFAKIGHGLIARRRAQQAMAQLSRESALQEELTRAQIANLNSLATSRGATEQTYDLTIPGQDQGAMIGPTQPEVIRGLKPNEYATQRRLYYPEPKTPTEITPYQQQSLDLRRRGLGLAQQRLDKAGAQSQEWRAAQAELANINADETVAEQKAKNIALGEANIYGLRAVSKDKAMSAAAIQALGGNPGSGFEGSDLLQYVDNLKKDYIGRRVSNAMTHVKLKNQPRRTRAEAVTQEAASLGVNADQQLLEQLKSIIEAPDEEQP